MDELIEVVARAIHAAESPNGSYEGFVAHTPDPQQYTRMAQAAINAIVARGEPCGGCGCAVYKGLPTAVARG